MIKRNPNIRKLAIAYAQGTLDLAEYRKLRTFQLSAIDFNKPNPDLPPKIEEIEIPSINIDPPNKPTSNNSFKKLGKILLIIIVLAAAGGGAYYLFGMENTPTSKKSSPTKKKVALTLEQRAHKMIRKRIWTNRDIEQFKTHWIKSSSSKRASARETTWFIDLETTIKERIDETKALIDLDEASEKDEALLNNLRLFYAYLKTE